VSFNGDVETSCGGDHEVVGSCLIAIGWVTNLLNGDSKSRLRLGDKLKRLGPDVSIVSSNSA
jgi:hypothetical protein